MSGNPGVDTQVTLRDVRRVQQLLKEQAPDLRRRMDRDVRRVLDPVVQKARGLMPSGAPLSRWNKTVNNPGSRPSTTTWSKRWEYDRLRYDAGEARQKIRVATGGRRRVENTAGRKVTAMLAYSVLQGSPAGGVFELAGRKKPGVNNFNRTMGRRYGKASRGIWRAWDTSGAHDRVLAEILGAVQATMDEYNRRLLEN